MTVQELREQLAKLPAEFGGYQVATFHFIVQPGRSLGDDRYEVTVCDFRDIEIKDVCIDRDRRQVSLEV